MKIRIFQMSLGDATKDLKFQSYNHIMRLCNGILPAEQYKLVYSGDVKANSLADVYMIFNLHHPDDFRGHSLSVSDIVEIIGKKGSTFYFCDIFSFRKVDFCKEVAIGGVADET